MILTNKVKTITKIASIIGAEANPTVKITYSHLQGMFVLEVVGLETVTVPNLDEALDNFIIAMKASLQKKLEALQQKHQKMAQEAEEILTPLPKVS